MSITTSRPAAIATEQIRNTRPVGTAHNVINPMGQEVAFIEIEFL